MKKQIPYIPKQSTDFRSMQYIYCESETSSKIVTRADFMRLLAQQPCPMAQVNIDLDGGYEVPQRLHYPHDCYYLGLDIPQFYRPRTGNRHS